MRRNPSKLQELEEENTALSDTLEEIATLADDADDAGLTREEIIAKLREIAELAESDDEEEAPAAGE
jgi:hypothetical protein